MRNADPVWGHVERHRDALVALADAVFDTPELLYEERLWTAPNPAPELAPC